MIFLTVLVAYLLIRWWGSAVPLHHDQWFHRWCDKVAELEVLRPYPGLVFAVCLLGPILALFFITALLVNVSPWLEMLIAVPVVLYSLGRGRFTRVILDYLDASEAGDWELAIKRYARLISVSEYVEPENDPEAATSHSYDQNNYEFSEGDWGGLNRAMFSAVCYRAFERVFAVLLWLILVGPAGALMYRLSALYLESENEKIDSDVAARWLWALEWPAVRAIGLSFALTGNFANCIKNWQNYLWDFERSSEEVIRYYCEGALSVEDNEHSFDNITSREFKLTLSLFSRTIIFWICGLALGSVFIN